MSVIQTSVLNKIIDTCEEVYSTMEKHEKAATLYFYKSYPYLFSLLYSKYAVKQDSFINKRIEISCTFDPDTGFSEYDDAILLNYYNISDSKNIPLDVNTEILNKVRSNINEEVAKLHYLDINYFYRYDNESYGDSEISSFCFFLTNRFIKYFIIPIIEGKYNDELEKINKRCILEITLKE